MFCSHNLMEEKLCVFSDIFCIYYKYYVYGHFWLSCLSIKTLVPYIFQNINVLETGVCLHLQVKPTRLGPVDRASRYLQAPVLCFEK
jgi:hypothetical protein